MPLSGRDYDELRGLMGAIYPSASGVIAIAQTMPRWGVSTTAVAIAASGVMYCVAIHLPSDVTVTNISFLSGTAEATGTHAWMALYTGDLRLLAQTADDTAAAAIGANAVYTRALSTPVKTTYSGLYYLGISVTATTMPTASGAVSTNQSIIPPISSGSTGSALLGVAPAQAAALTATGSIPYMFVT